MISVPTDVNAELLLAAAKAFPAAAAGNLDTGWIDRQKFASAAAFGSLGTSGGSVAPTSQSLALQIFDADDSSGTGAAQYKQDGVNNRVSAVGITGVKANTDNTLTQLGVNLMHARRWVKVRGVLAFVGGTSPVNDAVVGLMLGGALESPTAAPNP